MIRFSLLAALLALPVLVAPAVAQQTAALATADSAKLGTYVTDGAGHALYMFESDRQGTSSQGASSSCGGDCAVAWPPLLTAGPPTGATGIAADKLETLDRGDGTLQVTYGGWPLYTFQGDAAPGDTKGQGVSGFGGGWYVMTPEGRVNRKAP